MFGYLAGPVDGVDAESARGWRAVVTEELLQREPRVVVFSPPHAMVLGADVVKDEAACESIIAVNQMALSRADFVIANLNGPSFGTPSECLEAPCPVIGFASGEALQRMQRSVYQHRFAWLAPDAEQAVAATCQLLQDLRGEA